MRVPILGACLGLCLTLPSFALPQAGAGGDLPSRVHRLATSAAIDALPPLDPTAPLAEDALAAGKLAPFRFGIGRSVSLGLENAGAWEDLPDGTRLWRLRIESPGALSLNLIFDRFELPEGARLFVHNDAGRVLGAFTAELNRPHGMFATEPLAGDAVSLEYSEPQAGPLGRLRLSEVIHAYRDVLARPDHDQADHQGGAGGTQKASGACNINVNCPLGAGWQDQKRSVARVIMGGVLCSGALINNTAEDRRQYFLTANHCYSGDPATWIFNFNYESPTCNGTTGVIQSVSGSVLRLKSPQADFCLVEITQDIPALFDVFLAGWSRATTPSTISTGMHHPQGDIKKICQDTDPVSAASFNGASCWRVASWEQGVTEPGSSGSPLFDQDKRIVGQLFGGQATCSFLFNDYYGRFDVSMGNGLAAWLDPLGSGQTTLDGIDDNQVALPSVYCTAKPTSQGALPSIGYQGSPSQVAGNLILYCSSGAPGGLTLLVAGSGQNNAPFLGGTLCVQQPLAFGSLQAFDAFGLVLTPFDVTPAMVGGIGYFQYWGRDPSHSDGTGALLSDALEVPFTP